MSDTQLPPKSPQSQRARRHPQHVLCHLFALLPAPRKEVDVFLFSVGGARAVVAQDGFNDLFSKCHAPIVVILVEKSTCSVTSTSSSMRHFIYDVQSSAPAPAGGFDAGSWFRFYKWDVADEVFVPVAGSYRPDFFDCEKGDLLWFSVDGVVVGCAPIVRVMDEPAQMKTEVWYNAGERQVMPSEVLSDAVTGVVPQELGEEWAKKVKEVF